MRAGRRPAEPLCHQPAALHAVVYALRLLQVSSGSESVKSPVSAETREKGKEEGQNTKMWYTVGIITETTCPVTFYFVPMNDEENRSVSLFFLIDLSVLERCASEPRCCRIPRLLIVVGRISRLHQKEWSNIRCYQELRINLELLGTICVVAVHGVRCLHLRHVCRDSQGHHQISGLPRLASVFL